MHDTTYATIYCINLEKKLSSHVYKIQVWTHANSNVTIQMFHLNVTIQIINFNVTIQMIYFFVKI